MKVNMLYFNQHLAIYLLGVSDSAKVNTVFFSSLRTKWSIVWRKGFGNN